MYKIKINREKCNGCRECVRVCPSNWKILDDKKAHVVRFKVNNIGCNELAEKACPKKAISISRL